MLRRFKMFFKPFMGALGAVAMSLLCALGSLKSMEAGAASNLYPDYMLQGTIELNTHQLSGNLPFSDVNGNYIDSFTDSSWNDVSSYIQGYEDYCFTIILRKAYWHYQDDDGDGVFTDFYIDALEAEINRRAGWGNLDVYEAGFYWRGNATVPFFYSRNAMALNIYAAVFGGVYTYPTSFAQPFYPTYSDNDFWDCMRVTPYWSGFTHFEGFAINQKALRDAFYPDIRETVHHYYNGMMNSDAYGLGYNDGYSVGYNAGNRYTDPNDRGFMFDLFGAIVSVPVETLNGLEPLVIWNTPIISIIVTFLFLGVIVWLLRRIL